MLNRTDPKLLLSTPNEEKAQFVARSLSPVAKRIIVIERNYERTWFHISARALCSRQETIALRRIAKGLSDLFPILEQREIPYENAKSSS